MGKGPAQTVGSPQADNSINHSDGEILLQGNRPAIDREDQEIGNHIDRITDDYIGAGFKKTVSFELHDIP